MDLTKRTIKRGLLASRALRLAPYLRGVAILMYHSVIDDIGRERSPLKELAHPTSVFRRQMEVLARHYNPASLEDVLAFVEGKKEMPARPVAVTFDDGYRDNFETAAPILNHFGIPGAFFLTVNAVNTATPPWFIVLRHAFAGSPDKCWSDPAGRIWPLSDAATRRAAFLAACQYCGRLAGEAQTAQLREFERQLHAPPLSDTTLMLSWEEARALVWSGHTVGSHTLSHPNLAHVDNRDLARELADSKRELETRLAMPVLHFSYPNPILSPHWAEHTIEATRHIGYRTAVTTTPGLVRPGDNPLALRRVRPTHVVNEMRWNLECVFLGTRG